MALEKEKLEDVAVLDKRSKDHNKKDNTNNDVSNYEYDTNEFKKNLTLYTKILDQSDDVVSEIYKFMNKTLDPPTKAEIELYRRSIIIALRKGNHKKYSYLYKIIAKNVYDYKNYVTDKQQRAQNQIIINPNIFAISWDDLQNNIKDKLRNVDSDKLSANALEKAYKDELDKVKKLYEKLTDMKDNGIDVSTENLDITRSTMLKLTDLVNIFMLENFDEMQPLMQEIQIFEKYHSFSTEKESSIFIDANYKNITNLAPPKKNADAATKKYVDDQITKILNQINGN